MYQNGDLGNGPDLREGGLASVAESYGVVLMFLAITFLQGRRHKTIELRNFGH
jgi:hypothetical protein